MKPTIPAAARGLATLIPLTARHDWDAALEGIPHAFAHTWTSCHAMSLTTKAPTYLYVWESDRGRAVCPVAERTWQGQRDVYTPYGFSGFSGTGDWRDALAGFKRVAAERGWVCGYIIINPWLTDAACFDACERHESNDLYALDLRQTEEALVASLSANRRKQVRDIRRAPETFDVDREACRRFLVQHFDRFYESRSASSVYRLSAETLEHLIDSDRALMIGSRRGDAVQAVCLLVFTPFAGDYFAGISTPDGRRHSAALLWLGALELKRRGVPMLNLGGGVTRGDGIAEFKARFGALQQPLRALKQVYREDLYRQLCRNADVDPVDRSGFFPPYQRALRQQAEASATPNVGLTAGDR